MERKDVERNVELSQGWDSGVPIAPEVGEHAVADAVGVIASAAADANAPEAETLERLRQVMCMMLQSGGDDGKADRYVPFMRLGRRRSMEEEDLDTEDTGLLLDGATKAGNPRVCFRLADVAWRNARRVKATEETRRRCVETAAKAIEGMMKQLRENADEAHVDSQHLITRAASLAKEIRNTSSEAVVRQVAHELLERTEDQGQKTPPPWMAEAAQCALVRLGTERDEARDIAKCLARIGERYRDEKLVGQGWQESIWKEAAKWAGKAGEKELEQSCWWELGEAIIVRAGEEQEGDALRLAGVYEDAAPHLEKGAAGNAPEERKRKLAEVKRKQVGFAERLKRGEGLHPIEIEAPQAMVDERDRIHAVLEDLPLEKLMGYLGLWANRPMGEEYHREMAKSWTGGLLAQFFRNIQLDGGRIRGSGGWDQALANAFSNHTSNFVNVRIAPAMEVLARKHAGPESRQEMKERLRQLCRGSRWVPPGQVQTWVEGLMAGFEGRWKQCMDALIPAVEGALRHTLKEVSEYGLKRGQRGGQEERLLGEMLRKLGWEKAIHPDWRFELVGMLEGEGAWNLRNDHCHGLLDDAAYGLSDENGQQAPVLGVYFWQVMLHFVMCGAILPTHPLRSVPPPEKD